MKGIVSLSGGRDSSTLLAYVVEKLGAENVSAVSFDYGSKHPEELYCAKKIAEYYGIKEHLIIKIDPSVFNGSTSTLLEGRDDVQLDKTYAEIQKESEGKVDTYIPARNFLFSAYIAAFAESKVQQYDDDVIYFLGQHADDGAGGAYPDCTPEFTDAIALATKISSNGRVHSESPFIHMTKAEVIKLAVELNVPLDMTLSCYDPITTEDGVIECGRCATCLDVKNAMQSLGLEYKPSKIIMEK